MEANEQDGVPGYLVTLRERVSPGTARRMDEAAITADGSDPVVDGDRTLWTLLAWIPKEGEWSDGDGDDEVLLRCPANRGHRFRIPLGVLIRRVQRGLGSGRRAMYL